MEIQSCWELLCTKPHHTAPRSPDWHSFRGPTSSLRWLEPATEQCPRVPAQVPSPSCWWPVKEQLAQTYPELLLFWDENTRFYFGVFFLTPLRALWNIVQSELC